MGISRKSLYLFIFISQIFIYSGAIQANEEKLEQDTSVYSALSMGSGWALTQSHVVTNFHVIDGMQNLRLVMSDQKEIPVDVVLVDKKNDLAVLYIRDKSIRIKPLPLALTKPRLGSQVFTIGYPHPNLMGTSPKLTSGLINATSGLADDPRTFQISVPIQSGNSGGPLLNMRGEVVGVITSKLSAQKMFEWTGDIPQNVNYAIKINRLSSLISELETDEQVKAGGTKQDQNLETLAEKIVDSVIIIAGDGNKQEMELQRDFYTKKQQGDLANKSNKLNILVYSYTEPSSYYPDENIKDYDDTVHNYSKSVVDMLKKQLQKHVNSMPEFVSSDAKKGKSVFYRLENVSYSQSLCKKNKVNNIVASYSEDSSGTGSHFRLVSYRMFDCATLKEFKKEYYLERDELNDRFGYEVAFYTSFKDFLIKVPPYVSWSNL